ncbi:hydroxymethylpyrimidine/phosphomethylpyrimidine kinase [Sulfuritortus calidifontis]|uniref:hydroxymethylpyrimidine kinase n=1 Tax=Sulfuritortus calidifontis TaxID=1914471 RepID=A0A4R3JTZ5_9PROT|nr:hydroxymethylpyrimidine/phosphomethylpyrimidine kinase [Sulfuritortus calidifontis]TCS71010.1 hydroxymethylpyrimidine/phosphomethylpyrimidine kinase [Sulfuritortus calidifontis]
MPSFTPPAVLTFAATDPTCGAGLQADVLTLTSLGCHPLAVVTAITVQDSVGVEDFTPLEAEWIVDQARSVLEDIPVAAFKIGMLGSVEAVMAIAEVVSDYPDVPLILDPVLASGRGDELATETLIDAMKDMLLPQTTLITPNSLEARRLALDEGVDSEAPDLEECAERLLDMGCEYVLITGAHENETLAQGFISAEANAGEAGVKRSGRSQQAPQVVNRLYGTEGLIQTLNWERLPGSYHGSGCTLASAIAALMAQGADLLEAVKRAQEFTYQSLQAAYRPGMGQHIPDRFYWARGGDDA